MIQAIEARPTALGRLALAVGQLGMFAMLSMLVVLIGWFFTETLVLTLGPVRHGLRFFEIASVIDNPASLFGVGDSSPLNLIFGALCLLCLLAPLLPQWTSKRGVWVAHWAPLILLLVAGGIVYYKASSALFPEPANADVITKDLMRLANDVIHRGGGLVVQRISIGPGGYLALLGSIALALHGTLRNRDPVRSA